LQDVYVIHEYEDNGYFSASMSARSSVLILFIAMAAGFLTIVQLMNYFLKLSGREPACAAPVGASIPLSSTHPSYIIILPKRAGDFVGLLDDTLQHCLDEARTERPVHTPWKLPEILSNPTSDSHV
jgi:hypothetical protein